MAGGNNDGGPAMQKSVSVYVMLPLDPTLNDALSHQLGRLKDLQVEGVMFDVWWGWCEPKPQEYDFQRYVDLMHKARELCLKVQAVMSFHACGGNVGDDVNVPIPQWIHDMEGIVPELFYKDQEGRVNKEYVSLSCDNLKVFPCKDPAAKRTAVDMYRDYMNAFADVAKSFLDDGTLVELQIGTGPCGELRYPAYPLSMGWEYPNVGAFMCYDQGMFNDMKLKLGREEPPKNVGHFNQHPDESDFFNRTSSFCDEDDNFRSLSGSQFTEWYGNVLLEHGDRVMAAARDVFPVDRSWKVNVAIKVPGIHWLNAHPSHAAEVTAGLVGRYLENICKMLAKHKGTLDFTCLEMETAHQSANASSRPERLVAEAMHTAEDAGIGFAAENALPVHGDDGFNQIVRQLAFGLSQEGATVEGFTLLRLTNELVDADGPLCASFANFLHNMRNIGGFKTSKDCACHLCILLELPELPDISKEKPWKPTMVEVQEDKADQEDNGGVLTGDNGSSGDNEDEDVVPDLDNRPDSIVVTQRPRKKEKGAELARMATAS